MDAACRAGEALRIIVADDDDDARRVVAHLFGELEGFDVVGTAQDMTATLELVAERRPDVVLLDRVMPGFTGPDAVDGLRIVAPDTAIVVLSGYGRDDPEAAAVGAVVDGFVEKGAPKRVVVRAVVEAANGKTRPTFAPSTLPEDQTGRAPSLEEIADALHDETVGSLSSALWMLESLEQAEGERREELVAELRTSLRTSLASTRRVVRWAREHADPAERSDGAEGNNAHPAG